MADEKNMYQSALSIYHSAQCVFEIEEEFVQANDEAEEETPTIKAESKETLPIVEEKSVATVVKSSANSKNINNNYENDNYLKIRRFNLFIPWIALILYLLDVISDQLLAIRYATKGQWVYSALTTIFVLLPSFYLSLFVGKTWRKIIAKGWKYYPLLLPLVFFNLEPAVHYVTNYFTVRKYLSAKKANDLKSKKKYYDKYINGNRSVSDLKYSESLMEALPQFTLQGYIILSGYDMLELNYTVILQITSLTTSILGLAIIIYMRHKIWLLAHGFKISEFGRVLWTSGRFFSLVARTLSMTTSASLYTGYTFLVIGIHWIVAVIWRYVTHIKILGYIEPIFQGAADTLVARVDSLKFNIVSNLIILTENIVMMTIWFCHVNESYDSIKLSLFVSVICISGVGCFSDIFYKKYNKYFMTKIES